MNWRAEQYDDDQELTEYIWHNYQGLMTDLERRAARALLTEAKAREATGASAKLLRERWGRESDPQIATMLQEGADAFRRRVRERILSETPEAAFINRCPACGRIVATPRAKQCLWCGHDWHNG
jgi:hypothetical protein